MIKASVLKPPFIVGDSYIFKLFKITEKYSIVEYESKTYYYPNILDKNIKEVSLKIKNITSDNKVEFITDFFEYLGLEEIIADIYNINNNNPYYGLLDISYNGKIYQRLRCPKWVIKDSSITSEIFYNNKIKLKVKKNENRKFLAPIYDHSISHYKFEKNHLYDLKIVKVDKERDILTVLDEDSNIHYSAKSNFASLKIKVGDKRKFRYLFLKSNLQPVLIENEKSEFIKLETLFDDKQIKLILKDHLVNQELYNEFKSKIFNKDNFWTITAINYFQDVIGEYIRRRKFDEAKEFCIICDKISGFLNARNFFNKIPQSTKEKIKDSYDKDVSSIKYFFNFLIFLENYQIEDLFKYNISSPLQKQIEVLKTSFSLGYLNIKNAESFNQILKNISERNSDNYEFQIIYNGIRLIVRHNFIKPFLDNYRRKFFIDNENKKKWLKENKFEFVLSILIRTLNFLEEVDDVNITNYDWLDYISIMSLKDSYDGNSDQLENLCKAVNILIPEKESKTKVNKKEYSIVGNEIEIFSEGFVLDYNFFVFASKNLFLLVKSKDAYLINLTIRNFGSISLEIINNYQDILIYAHLDISKYLNYSNEKKIDNNIVLYRKIGNVFASKFYNKGIIDEKIFVPHNNLLFNDNRFSVGDVIESYETKNNIFHETITDISNLYQKECDGIVKNIFYYKDQCPSCSSDNVIKNNIILYCKECNYKYSEGAEIYFQKYNRSIFICSYSIVKLGGLTAGNDFFKEIKIGDTYKFRVLESKYRYSIIDENNSINDRYLDSIIFQKVNVISKKSLDSSFYDLLNKNLISYSLNSVILISENIISQIENDSLKKELREITQILYKYFRHPKSYVSDFSEIFDNVILSIRKKEDFKKILINEFNALDSTIKKTIEYFPNIGTAYESLKILKYLGDDKYENQVNDLKLVDGKNKKLLKAVLIRNLIFSEDSQSLILKNIENQIIELLENQRSDISFKYSLNTDTVDLDLELIRNISERKITESSDLELKETFIVPVLNRDQKKQIIKFEDFKISQPDKTNVWDLQIKNIYKELKDKRNDVSSKQIIMHSVFKNISAFLNTCDGKIIIGINDDQEIVGLDEDFNEFDEKNFDSFQLKYTSEWDNFIFDGAKFRPYVKIYEKKFNTKSVCIIDVKYPYDISDPCYVKPRLKDKKSEIAYERRESSAFPMSSREIRQWKRKTVAKGSKPHFVYLMRDKYDVYKIGIAYDPLTRRGTLMSQAQDPQLTLIKSWIFPTLQIAKTLESSLHSKYEKIHNNGEWYDVNEEIIEKVDKFLIEQQSIFKTDKSKLDKKQLKIANL